MIISMAPNLRTPQPPLPTTLAVRSQFALGLCPPPLLCLQARLPVVCVLTTSPAANMQVPIQLQLRNNSSSKQESYSIACLTSVSILCGLSGEQRVLHS